MTTDTSVADELGIYVCPICKVRLRQKEGALRCPSCSQVYPIMEGIPDFISEDLSRSTDPVLRRMRFIDHMAGIYETRLWYPIVLYIYGGSHSPSLAQLISTVSHKVQSTKAGCWISPAAPAPLAGGSRHRRGRCSESTYRWECFGKAPLTLLGTVFPTCISPVQE
jgi:uncharacterized protein YbaR (Trm112 family)